MKRSIGVFLLLLGLHPLVAADDPERHGERPPMSDAQYWAGVFDAESRDHWQKPLTVIEFLGIRPGNTVADLGAGTGYFTSPMSRQVGTEGRVYAVDIEQAMLDYLKQREDVRQDQVTPILAEPDDPKLPDNEIDLVLIVNTWHHIEDRMQYMERLMRSLKRYGRVAVIDFRQGELPVGPPPVEKLAREIVVREFTDSGWTLASESVALPYQYMLVFYPPRKGPERPVLPPR